MKARHKRNPPDEVMKRQMNPSRKSYLNSYKDRLALAIKTELGVNPLENIRLRAGNYPISRQVFLVMMKRKYYPQGQTLQDIANELLTKHDYVLYSEIQVNNRMCTDNRFREQYERIEAKLKYVL